MSKRTLFFILLFIDLILLNISLALVSFFHYGTAFPATNGILGSHPVFVIIVNFTWILTYIVGLNDNFFEASDLFNRAKEILKRVLLYILCSSFLIVVFDFDHISRTMLLGSCGLFLILKFIFSFFSSDLIARRADGPYYSKILIVGTNDVGVALQSYYNQSLELGTIIGFLDSQKHPTRNLKVLGTLSDFQKVFDEYHFNDVIITIPLSRDEDIKKLVNLAEYNGVRPAVVANYYSLFGRNFDIIDRGGIPIVKVREVPLSSFINRARKRIFDFIFSFLAIVTLFPFFLLLAMIIKIDSKGPVFYQPTRIGKRGAKIKVIKFRSMRHGHETQTRSAILDDERITRVGKFMRKYSIDELPQLVNVLKGEMSVVGPRPHRTDLNKRFQETAQNYMVRQYIKPGITGWAQVNGFRGPTDVKHQYVGRTLHDLWYIEHWSFALDIYIIYLTIFGNKTRTNAF